MTSESSDNKDGKAEGTNGPTDAQRHEPNPPASHAGSSAIEPPPSHASYKIACEKKRDKWDRLKLAGEFFGIFVVTVYTAVTIALYCTGKDSLEWITNQTRQAFPRPTIWVKMPDNIQIEPDKPIRPDIQIFNYGDRPGIARARIRFEAGPGLVEKFRDMMLHHGDDFTIRTDMEQVDEFEAFIPAQEGRRFPIESPELKLSRQDIDRLISGAIDVAIYGRIFYSDLNHSAFGRRNEYYRALFCIHVMRDGKTTAPCPNQYQAYTNWAP